MKLNIAYFLSEKVGLGGADNVLVQQAKIMSTVHNVIVVIPKNEVYGTNQELLKRCRKEKLKCAAIEYSISTSVRGIDVMSAIEEVSAILEFLTKNEINLIHSVQLNIALEMAARKLKIPHLMNIYQIRREEKIINYLDIFPRYHSCDSELYCKVWGEILHADTFCIRPVSPIEIQRKRTYEKKDKIKILMLGLLAERKRQMYAIRAVERLLRKGYDIELTIAGSYESKYGLKCREYIIDNSLADNIHMLGFVSDVEGLLEENDCILCASITESFPSSLVEALSFDLTIISTPVAGVPEIFKDKENSYICKGFEVDDLAESVEECIMSYGTNEIEIIHRNASKTWNEEFSISSVRKKLDDCYRYIYQNNQDVAVTDLHDIIESTDIKKISSILYAQTELPDIAKSHAYYYNFLLKRNLSGKAYLWGTGRYGEITKKLIDLLFPQIEIINWVDQNRSGVMDEIEIIQPEEMKLPLVDFVFICFADGAEEAIDELKGMKYLENIYLLP